MITQLVAIAVMFGSCSRVLLGAEASGAVETNAITDWFPVPATNAFNVFGRVTSSGGIAIAGVELRACCGVGTLRCTGKTTTDSHGLYGLSFGPGMLMGTLFSSGQGVGFQAATVFAQKTGYSCVDLGRAGNLAMTDLNKLEPSQSHNFAGIVYPFKPYRLDFVLQTAANVKGRILISEGSMPEKLTLSLAGKALPPSSSVLASIELNQTNTFMFEDVPIGSNWWFEASWREEGQWKVAKSEPFSCKSAREHKVTIELSPGGDLKLRNLQ